MSYIEHFPEHERTSCSDANPINAAAKDGCGRCTSMVMDQRDELAALLWRARTCLAWAIDGGTPSLRRPQMVERPALMLKSDYDEALAVCEAIAKATGRTE